MKIVPKLFIWYPGHFAIVLQDHGSFQKFAMTFWKGLLSRAAALLDLRRECTQEYWRPRSSIHRGELTAVGEESDPRTALTLDTVLVIVWVGD